MKKRIEELKKMSSIELLFVCKEGWPFSGQCAFGMNVTYACIEVVSARMWEKAAEADVSGYLCKAMTLIHPADFPIDGQLSRGWNQILNYFCYDATTAEKLICAIAALEAKEAK